MNSCLYRCIWYSLSDVSTYKLFGVEASADVGHDGEGLVDLVALVDQ